MIPKKASRVIIALTGVLCVAFSSFVNLDDDPVVVKIVTQLHQWLSANPTEKVYLQLDKPYYAAGDNIWFKAYVTANNKPSALSGTLNVELIDDRDSVKRHIKLELNNGIAWGDFILPDTLHAGNYRLLAYTNWMRNAGADYYFDKTITIGNTDDRYNSKAKPKLSNTGTHMADVQFFPESGNLVNGLRSKVAIKVIGANGLGIDITGTIIDNENKTVSNITHTHLGMGIFALTPQSGKTYKALLTYPNGLKSTVNLPLALNSGYVLTINNSDPENIGVKVAASPNMPNAGKFYIIAQSAAQVQFIADNKKSGNSFSMSVPKSKFPSGIVQFTLFSSLGQPLNERVAFIQHPADLLQLDIAANKSTALISQPYQFNLTAKTNDGKPVAGNFSVSVVDESKVPDDATDQTTILSHLLLTSDLRGYIEQPAYYFENINETTRANLDVLMLTQGYRRFNWKPLLADQIAPPKYVVENAIDVSGKVISNYGKKPVANARISLFSRADGLFFRDTVADEQGRFAFKNLVLDDSIRLVLQARTPKNGRYVTMQLDDYKRTEALGEKWKPKKLSRDNLDGYLAASKVLFDQEIKYGIGNHTILLKQVEVRAKTKKPVLSYSSNISGAGNADQVFTNDAIYKYGPGHLEDFLRSRINGVVFNEGIPYTLRAVDSSGKPPPMLVLINGLESPNGIADLMTSDVGSVEVLKGNHHTALFGPRAMRGVIIVNLKTGIDAMNNLSQIPSFDVITLKPIGYYASREFYSPKYDDPKTNKALADLRTTIYWNPNVITDNTGHASLEYHNAGTPGTYRVIIEGMDAEGRLGREVFRYKFAAE